LGKAEENNVIGNIDVSLGSSVAWPVISGRADRLDNFGFYEVTTQRISELTPAQTVAMSLQMYFMQIYKWVVEKGAAEKNENPPFPWARLSWEWIGENSRRPDRIILREIEPLERKLLEISQVGIDSGIVQIKPIENQSVGPYGLATLIRGWSSRLPATYRAKV
jgi:hypothetical protein